MERSDDPDRPPRQIDCINYQQVICMSGDKWSLETLFDMVGIGELGGGYWYKIEAEHVEPSSQRPHGIKYSLTLHGSVR
jgi:hypothetical protein